MKIIKELFTQFQIINYLLWHEGKYKMKIYQVTTEMEIHLVVAENDDELKIIVPNYIEYFCIGYVDKSKILQTSPRYIMAVSCTG